MPFDPHRDHPIASQRRHSLRGCFRALCTSIASGAAQVRRRMSPPPDLQAMIERDRRAYHRMDRMRAALAHAGEIAARLALIAFAAVLWWLLLRALVRFAPGLFL